MRKKNFALMMAGILCSSIFMSGCGKAADIAPEVASDSEDEEDDPEEDEGSGEDSANEEEQSAQKPAIVKEIDDETLASQVDIFLADREDWVIPAGEAVNYDSTFYCLNDLNFNGRADLIAGGWSGATNMSFVNIYEINEEENGFDLLEWSFSGLDEDKKPVPDFSVSDYVQGYFDKNTGTAHFLFTDYYLNSFSDGGTRHCDVYISDNTVNSQVFAMSRSQGSDGDEVDKYYDLSGEITEGEFYSTLYFHAYSTGLTDFMLGFYYGDSSNSWNSSPVEYMSSDELRDILTDSYLCFAGKLDFSSFCERYRVADSSRTPEELFELSVGDWELYMSDTEGDITYYEEDDEHYSTLEIRDDWTLHLTERPGSGDEYTIDMNMFEHGDGTVMGSFVPASGDGMYYDDMVISIVDINEDGLLVLTTDTWKDNSYMGGSTWYFRRSE